MAKSKKLPGRNRMNNGRIVALACVLAAALVIALVAFVPIRPMSSLVLVIALSTLIYLTFAIGWTAHWLYAKYIWSRDGESIERELEKRVYEAETEKDAAVHKLHEVEDAFESYARQAEADHAATLDELGRARREAEYYRQQQLGHPGS